MQVISETEEVYKILADHVNEAKPTYCAIMTYGAYIGITADGRDCHEWGGKYANPVRPFLDALVDNEIKTKIVVGEQTVIECTPGCEFCKQKNENLQTRIGLTIDKYSGGAIEWRINPALHAKMIVFSTNWCMVGGRNLTSSDWIDYSFWIEDKSLAKKLGGDFAKYWKEVK